MGRLLLLRRQCQYLSHCAAPAWARGGGETTRRIGFAWAIIRFYGEWFLSTFYQIGVTIVSFTNNHAISFSRLYPVAGVAPMLMDIADAAAEESSLDLHISIFCDLSVRHGTADTPALPAMPNSTVTRPDVYRLLARIFSYALVEEDVVDESERKAGDERVVARGGAMWVYARMGRKA
jgi:hypothetical protein